MAHHDLKLWPMFFDAKVTGKKPWEIRSTRDRAFRVGDTVTFHSWGPNLQTYMGDTYGPCTITFIASGEDHRLMRPGTCIFTHTPQEVGS